MSVRISVVIPCHNAGRYLGSALDSIAIQEIAAVEVIVVDDGSTDGSADVAERHPVGARIIRQVNKGISAARNRGIEAARGGLIAFLDADDLWTTHSLGMRLEALERDASLDCAAGLVTQFISPELAPEVRARLVCPAEASRGRVAGALLVRREVFARVGVFDTSFSVGETMDWVARADAAGVRTSHVEAVVLRRRIHGSNSVQKEARLKAEYLRVLRSSIERRRRTADQAP